MFAFAWLFILTQVFVATPSWGLGTLRGCIEDLIEYGYNQLSNKLCTIQILMCGGMPRTRLMTLSTSCTGRFAAKSGVSRWRLTRSA